MDDVDPKNMEDALAIKDRVVGEIQDIQAQLSNRNKEEFDGARMESHEYHEWRRRAAYALRVKQAHLRKIKEWMRKHQKSGEWSLLARAYRWIDVAVQGGFMDMATEGVTDEADALRDAIEHVVPREILERESP